MEKLEQALKLYENRKSRKSHPPGTFDKAGRWDPDDGEYCDCCKKIRTPTRAYPYSLMTHCRTADHIAVLMGVDAKELKKAIRAKNPSAIQKKEIAYKKVALVDGELRSVFGKQKYIWGKPLIQKARDGHLGGFYVYATPEQAQNAAFPDFSAHEAYPKVIIEVEVSGRCIKYGHKMAWTKLVPIQQVCQI